MICTSCGKTLLIFSNISGVLALFNFAHFAVWINEKKFWRGRGKALTIVMAKGHRIVVLRRDASHSERVVQM
jgi:hypothetical protein